MNVLYVWIRTTENYEFHKIWTAGVTWNATKYKNSQGDNDNTICLTRDLISQPSRPISPRTATDYQCYPGSTDVLDTMSAMSGGHIPPRETKYGMYPHVFSFGLNVLVSHQPVPPYFTTKMRPSLTQLSLSTYSAWRYLTYLAIDPNCCSLPQLTCTKCVNRFFLIPKRHFRATLPLLK